MFVFTASYISTPERLAYLRLCTQSVQSVLPEATHVVSLCAAEGIDLSPLAALPCRVILRKQRMSQFEQIDLLLTEVELADDDFVMLLDDDDLLLERPSLTRVLKSTQALYRGTQDQRLWSEADVQRILTEEYRDEDWEFVRDLSGYGCRVELLRHAPYHRPDTFAHFGDLDFMNYINSLEEGISYQRPYIFHRMHATNGTESDWSASLMEEMTAVQEQMERISKELGLVQSLSMPSLDLTCACDEEYVLDDQTKAIRDTEREVDRLSRVLYRK